MKQISVFQFLQNINKACIQFAQAIQPQAVEEVELQSEEQWWEEFKQYMEDV